MLVTDGQINDTYVYNYFPSLHCAINNYIVIVTYDLVQFCVLFIMCQLFIKRKIWETYAVQICTVKTKNACN